LSCSVNKLNAGTPAGLGQISHFASALHAASVSQHASVH